MPKTVKWILLSCSWIFILMTAFRLLTIYVLKLEQGSAEPLWQLLLMGAGVDLKYLAVLAIILFMLFSIPGIHPFKHSGGKRVALWVFASVLLLLFSGFVLDFAALAQYKTHIDSNLLIQCFSDLAALKSLFFELPALTFVIAAGIGAWLSYLLIMWLHDLIKRKSTNKAANSSRLLAQIIFVAICIGFYLIPHTLDSYSALQENNAIVVFNFWSSVF